MELEEMRLYFKMPSSAFRRKKFFVDPSSLLPFERVRVFFIIFFFSFLKFPRNGIIEFLRMQNWRINLSNRTTRSFMRDLRLHVILYFTIVYYWLVRRHHQNRRKRKKEMVETSSDKKLVCKDVNETVCFLREAKLWSISNEP